MTKRTKRDKYEPAWEGSAATAQYASTGRSAEQCQRRLLQVPYCTHSQAWLGSTPRPSCPREHPARSVSLVDLAPLLIEQRADPAFFSGDLLQLVEAVEQQITQVRHILLPLYPQMGNARAGEDAQRHVQQQLTLRCAGGRVKTGAQTAPHIGCEEVGEATTRHLPLDGAPRSCPAVLLSPGASSNAVSRDQACQLK